MNAHTDLDRELGRLIDKVGEYALAKVRAALELERARFDEDIAELRDEILTLSRRIDATQTREGGPPTPQCRATAKDPARRCIASEGHYGPHQSSRGPAWW